MSMTGLFPIKHRGPGRAVVAGSFVTVNGAVPTVLTGRGFTVARSAEGVWVVTLLDTPNAIDAILHSAAWKTADGTLNLEEDFDERTSTTFTLNAFVVAGAATDDPGTIISFAVYLRNTNVDDP